MTYKFGKWGILEISTKCVFENINGKENMMDFFME
jgi:hypothetical protein